MNLSTATLIRPMAGGPRNGLPEWKPYAYNGTGKDTLTAFMDDDEPVWPHGTYTGYGRHRQAGEPPCEPCREAVRQYQRARRRAAS